MRPAEKVLKELIAYQDPWHKQNLQYYFFENAQEILIQIPYW